jgi:hypothetical protein
MLPGTRAAKNSLFPSELLFRVLNWEFMVRYFLFINELASASASDVVLATICLSSIFLDFRFFRKVKPEKSSSDMCSSLGNSPDINNSKLFEVHPILNPLLR